MAVAVAHSAAVVVALAEAVAVVHKEAMALEVVARVTAGTWV